MHAEERTRYYHGGAPDLSVILPPADTRARSLADFGAGLVCRRDRVYVTTRYEGALIYAALHPSNRGMVYAVQPMGPLEDDPDFTPADGVEMQSLFCPWAQVRRRYRIPPDDLAVLRHALMAGRVKAETCQ